MTSSSSTRKGSLFVLEQTKGNKPSWIPEGQQCQQNSRPKQQVYANFSNQSSSNNGSSNMMKPRRMSESRIIRNQPPPSSSSSAKAITRISSKGNTSTMRPMDMKSPRSVVISPPPAPEPRVSSSPFAEQQPKQFQRRISSSLVVANSIEKPQRFQRSMQRKEQRSSARTSAADPRSRTNSTRSFSPSQCDDDDDVVDLDYSFDDGLNDGHLHEQEAEDGEEEEGMEMMMQQPGAYNVTPSSDLGPDTYFVSPRRSTSSSRSERDIMAQQQQQQSSVQSNTICDLDEEDDEDDQQFEYGDFEHVQNDNDSYFSEENYGDEDRTAEAELVIAAELSQDLEREIEERVRKQVMAEAAQAAVVGVSVGAHQQQVPRRTSSQSQLQPVPATHMSNNVCLRTQLPWRIEQESATMKYIAIVQTNPQAKNMPLLEQQRGERRFVASSKREAREIAISMATPRPLLPNYVQSSDQKSCCSLCQTNFSFFKRKKYSCINCGMTMLCQGCVATWHKDSVPSTYYCCTDKSSSNASSNTVQVCTICDWSARTFQKSLLSGDLGEARYLYKTHNINTRTPYNFLDNKSSKSNSKNKKEIL